MTSGVSIGHIEIERTATRVIDVLQGGMDIQEKHDRAIEIAVDGAHSMLDDERNLGAFREALARSGWRLAFLDARSFPRDDRFAPQLIAAFLDEWSQAIPKFSKKAQHLRRALSAIEWGTPMAEATQVRLRALVGEVRWILVIPGAYEWRDDAFASHARAVRWLADAVRATAIVYCGFPTVLRHGVVHRVAAPMFAWDDFVHSILLKLDGKAEATAGTEERSWLSRLLTAMGWKDAPTRGASRPSKVAWAQLIAYSAFPSWQNFNAVFGQLKMADAAIERWEKDRRAEAKQVGDMRDRGPETAELRARAYLLALLCARFPDIIHAARASLNGVYDLFRLQSRALAQDQSSQFAVQPSFEIDDQAFLIGLLQRAMNDPLASLDNDANETRALVSPFPSASALRRHLEWQFGAGQMEQAGLTEWETWIEHQLSGHIEALAKGASTVSIRHSLPWPEHSFGSIYPETAVERAGWLIEAAELERPLRVHRAEAGDAFGIKGGAEDHVLLVREAHALLNGALARITGTLRFEALLLLVRAEGMSGQRARAARLIELAQRVTDRPAGTAWQDDPRALLVKLSRAYIDELTGDLPHAIRQYESVAKVAEERHIDELLWRAAYGTLRSRLAQVHLEGGTGDDQALSHRSHRSLRAQILREVQTARSPRLIQLVKRIKPTVFISYRRECHAIVQRLATEIDRSQHAQAWFDDLIEQEHEDFSPRIQQELSTCDAVLFVVSENFFKSRYCSYELTFATAQHGLTAARMPMYWVVLESEEHTVELVGTGGSKPHDGGGSCAADALRRIADRTRQGVADANTQLAVKSHIDDVVEKRLLSKGKCVYHRPLKVRMASEVQWADCEETQGEVLTKLRGAIELYCREWAAAD